MIIYIFKYIKNNHYYEEIKPGWIMVLAGADEKSGVLLSQGSGWSECTEWCSLEMADRLPFSSKGHNKVPLPNASS